jgi:hypothetical protein
MMGLRESHGLFREAFIRTGLHKRDSIIKNTRAQSARNKKEDGWMAILFCVPYAGPGDFTRRDFTRRDCIRAWDSTRAWGTPEGRGTSQGAWGTS